LILTTGALADILSDLGEDLPHGLLTGIMHSLRVRFGSFTTKCNGKPWVIYNHNSCMQCLASSTGEVPPANLMLWVTLW